MNFFDFLDDHPELKFWVAMFIMFAIACLIINNKITKLWYVQSEIVTHDYGHVFETIEDWKLERIEKFEKEFDVGR